MTDRTKAVPGDWHGGNGRGMFAVGGRRGNEVNPCAHLFLGSLAWRQCRECSWRLAHLPRRLHRAPTRASLREKQRWCFTAAGLPLLRLFDCYYHHRQGCVYLVQGQDIRHPTIDRR